MERVAISTHMLPADGHFVMQPVHWRQLNLVPAYYQLHSRLIYKVHVVGNVNWETALTKVHVTTAGAEGSSVIAEDNLKAGGVFEICLHSGW